MFRWSKKKKQPANSETDGGATDQVTERFTVNLPNGHKTVVRVSPLTTVGELVASVCRDKGLDLDLSKYALKIPKSPATQVDLNATIKEMGVHELKMVSLGRPDRNHTVSMPDLSQLPPSSNQLPSFSPPNGQHKKRRGFLSFLGKKDKKYKSEIFRSMDTSFPSNLDISASSTPLQSTPTSVQRLGFDESHQVTRPRSMFVTSHTPILGDKSPEQNVTPLVAPPRKKRRAPEPPLPEETIKINENQHNQSLNEDSEIKEGSEDNSFGVQIQNEANQRVEVSPDVVSSQIASANEKPITLHSLDSSDSSGYIDLTLSRSESPKVSHNTECNIQTSVDMPSFDSTDSVTMDSRNFSPSRESPKLKVHEVSEDMPASDSPRPISDSLLPGDSNSVASNNKIKIPDPSTPIQTSPSSSRAAMTSTVTSSLSTPVKETTNSSSSITVTPTAGEDSNFNIQSHSDFNDRNESADIPNPEFPDFNEKVNEPADFDINDILDGVVFDEEPWSMNLNLAKRAGVGSSGKDSMMMMETASVTSENIEQMDNSILSERPCSFIPPPPPSEPPPLENVDIESFTYSTTPVFMDKSTEVNDDNTSLATSSAKSSPGRGSNLSVCEMALFVENMDTLTLESSNDTEDNLVTNTVTSPNIHDLSNNSNTASTTWHTKADFTTEPDSETGSLTREQIQNMRNLELQTQVHTNFEPSREQMKESFVASQAFDEKGGNLESNKTGGESDDEEYFTEVIEELIIPLGPNGYDFSAARKKSETDITIAQIADKDSGMDKFGAKSDFAVKSSFPTSTYKPQSTLVQPSKSFQLSKTKEFLPSTDELSHVSTLQPKFEESPPRVHLVSTSPVMSRPDITKVNINTTASPKYEPVQPEISRKGIPYNSETQYPVANIKKPTSLPKLPTMRPNVHTNNLPAPSEDDYTMTSDPILAKSRPHLLMNAQNYPSRRSGSFQKRGADYQRIDTNVQRSFNDGAGSDAVVDNVEQPGSIISAYNEDTQNQQHVLQRQYALQDQFHQWQQQLALNQNLLASQAVGSDVQSEQLQELMEQIAVQQQTMQQLQSTMLALQHQQHIHGNGQEHIELSAELPARLPQPLAGAAEPAYLVSEHQAPISSPPSKQSKVVKAVSGTTSKNRSKFERELGPREQLMIAIRTFSKGELKSVPIEKTRWTTSAL